MLWVAVRWYLFICTIVFFYVGSEDRFDSNELLSFFTKPITFIPSHYLNTIATNPVVSYANGRLVDASVMVLKGLRSIGKECGVEMDEFEDGVLTFLYFVSIKITETMLPIRGATKLIAAYLSDCLRYLR
jgi:hypothetical protein